MNLANLVFLVAAIAVVYQRTVLHVAFGIARVRGCCAKWIYVVLVCAASVLVVVGIYPYPTFIFVITKRNLVAFVASSAIHITT